MVEMLGSNGSTNVTSLTMLRDEVLGRYASLGDGAGIDVALIDTGVAPVAGLDGADKVLHGPDLSFEGAAPEVAYLDTYGHGTHLAGIIAGERNGHPGIAPGARIVSVKVAGHDGVTTVPQVVAAIDWVVEHRNTDGLNIRVLNLSLGQARVSSHVGDLLSAAVERAWNAGIVVVVAAGNRGETQAHLDSPAVDPYVLAVGASQTDILKSDVYVLSLSTVEDTAVIEEDTSAKENSIKSVPVWSAMGDTFRDPDVIAPGRSIASYRVPGSTVDLLAPGARYGTSEFLGSGTSQSAAVASGLAAALLSVHPDLTPDQVKATVEYRADEIGNTPATREGDGAVDGYETLAYAPQTNVTPQTHIPAAGAGTGIATPTGATWSGGTWSGGTWSGATWSGATWSGGTWSGATWSGATWSGATWSGATWSGGTWSGATWSGATWSGGTWSGATWSGSGWS
jgi:serine protease AprX